MIALMVRAQRPHSALQPRHPYICFGLRGKSDAASSEAALTALRTSWSLRTLQEQTIMKSAGPSVMLGSIDIEARPAMQKEKPQFQAIPN
jgi:hypothetical protein